MNLHVLAVIKMIEQVFEKKILNAKQQQNLFIFINFIILIDLRNNFISKKTLIMEPQAPPRMAGAAGDIHAATDEIQQHVDSVTKLKNSVSIIFS